jgi:FkbM family methyltransferase
LILANSRSQVLAFEPQIDAFNEAKKLASLYPNRITVVNVGVANNSGELTMYYGNESESATFSAEANEIPYVAKINSKKKIVKVVTLDDYMEENANLPWSKCSLLKIDTEGYEAEVLIGAQKFIDTMKPKYIQIEFNVHHLYRNHSFKMLAQLIPNYKPFRLLPFSAGMLPCEKEDVISNIFQYANYIFISKEELS